MIKLYCFINSIVFHIWCRSNDSTTINNLLRGLIIITIIIFLFLMIVESGSGLNATATTPSGRKQACICNIHRNNPQRDDFRCQIT